MQAEQRRQAILNLLKTEMGPVSAAALAARFSVSRQIIVGDIALTATAAVHIGHVQVYPEVAARRIKTRIEVNGLRHGQQARLAVTVREKGGADPSPPWSRL